jgi:hypothetical protein
MKLEQYLKGYYFLQQHLFGHVLSLYRIQSLYTRDKIKLSSIPSLGPKGLMLYFCFFFCSKQKSKRKIIFVANKVLRMQAAKRVCF